MYAGIAFASQLGHNSRSQEIASRNLLSMTSQDAARSGVIERAWRRFTVWKYPAVLLFGIWGMMPALQPGVSGFKARSDFLFGGRHTERIKPAQVHNFDALKPAWCLYDVDHGMDKTFRYAVCGVETNGKKLISVLQPMKPGWRSNNVAYEYGKLEGVDIGAEDIDLGRDWKWLEFFYGYNWYSQTGGGLIRLQPIIANSDFIAFLLFLSFVVFDLLLVIVVRVLRLFRGKSSIS